MAETTTFWTFILAFRRHWFAAMSGGVSVPFAAVAPFLDNVYAQALVVTLAFVAAWFAAYRIWKVEHEKVLRYEKRLTPKARVFLGQDGGIEKFRSPDGSRPKYVQVSVECCTEEPLFRCQAKLCKVEKLKLCGDPDLVLSNAVHCIWDNAPDGSNPEISIHPGVSQRANLFAIGEHSQILEMQFIQKRQKVFEEMQIPGDYRLSMAFVTDTTVQMASFIFHWGRSYEGVSIRPEGT